LKPCSDEVAARYPSAALASDAPHRLSATATQYIIATENTLVFNAASIWEIAIKSTLGRDDFRVDSSLFRRALLDNGYQELPVTGAHAAATAMLSAIHKDPFDRMLVAQSALEGILLLTADPIVAQYSGPIRQV
jgi:PIN domain nuclease of toxin-antitoxin system